MAVMEQELVEGAEEVKKDSIRTQLRGSSLLLGGRLLAVAINFAAQVLMVRYLTTSDYGALGYALSVITMLQTICMLQLQEVVARFVPIYHEREDYARLLGTLVLTVCTVMLTSGLLIVLFFAWPQMMRHYMSHESLPIRMLSIMIFLLPIQAIDAVFLSLFASFSSSKSIFIRRHLLAPGLILIAVALMITLHAKVTFLAYGYILANIIGIAAYSYMLVRLLRRLGLLEHLHFSQMIVPVKEIFGYSFPVLSSSLVSMTLTSAGVFLLGYFHTTVEVAKFRAVLPAAQLNNTVLISFTTLYAPLAARLFAKNDYDGINKLYWRTAVWMAVLTFPIFAATFCIAQPLVEFVFGHRYAASGPILALLSLGFYFNVALGFNGLTVKILGKLRYTVVINLLAAFINIGLLLLLIPRYGAMGAAIGTTATMIVHNLLKQAGLRLASGLSIFDAQYRSFYILIAGSSVGLFAIQQLISASVKVAAPLAAFVSILVFAVARKKLHVSETFPELLKVPGMRLIFE
jgi:O-antigen/teichoic acid export membrane protein